MKLRTYLRGLGLGLIVAALVTGVGSQQTMSDEQIKSRAKELGMMEGHTYLNQVDAAIETEETTETEETAETEEITETEETVETVIVETLESESRVELESETAAEETKAQETAPEAESETVEESREQPVEDTMAPETVTFQIHRGDSSVSVAKRLAEAGLVGDAKAFDRYLCQNGYDKKIRTGTYEIQSDSSNEEIAKIITAGK